MICSIATKIGCRPEVLGKWIRRSEEAAALLSERGEAN
jgi:hypothetical protein